MRRRKIRRRREEVVLQEGNRHDLARHIFSPYKVKIKDSNVNAHILKSITRNYIFINDKYKELVKRDFLYSKSICWLMEH